MLAKLRAISAVCNVHQHALKEWHPFSIWTESFTPMLAYDLELPWQWYEFSRLA